MSRMGYVNKNVNIFYYSIYGASPVAQMVKDLPAMQGTWVRPLAWEDDA